MKCKNAFYYLLLVAGCIAAARFCHHKTKGFCLAKIESNLDTSPCIAPLLSPSEIAQVRSLLAYPFRYYGRGHQSFVFLSDDGTHVIKLFNNGHQRKIRIFRWLSHVPFLNKWALSRVAYSENKLEQTFDSYRIAYDEMKDKTGLVCVHLHSTEGLPPLTLYDPLNICHRLNSNALGFLIQKKADLVYPTLEEWIVHQDLDKLKQAVSKLLDLCIWKSRHGICDNDPLIRTNFGFLDDDVIQIDVGPLSRNFSAHDPEKMREEIFRITASLKAWLAPRCPELVAYLDWELEDRLSY